MGPGQRSRRKINPADTLISRPRVVPRGGHTSAVMAMPSLTTRRGWVPAVTLPFSPRSVCRDLQLYISLGQTTELHFLPSPP